MANKVEILVEELALELLDGTEIELVDVEFVKERDWYLRVFIDKENGIDIEDCQNQNYILYQDSNSMSLIRSAKAIIWRYLRPALTAHSRKKKISSVIQAIK